MALRRVKGVRRRLDVIEGKTKAKEGRVKSLEAARVKGNGWELRIGQIKPQTKDFLSPHEISMA